MIVVNGDGAILGRLSSVVAKKLLMGEEIVVVNAEKIVVSGDPKNVLSRFLENRDRGDTHKGPFYPKYPDRIFSRCVKGMLPHKKQRGRDALKGLKVYMGCPEEFKNLETLGKPASDLRTKYVTLKDICRQLGAKLG